MDKNLTDTFISLTACELTEAEWLTWFGKNKELVETTCGRIAFLKIKPKESFSDIRNTYMGQFAVYNWLKTKNIATGFSDAYRKAADKEFEEFRKQEKQKTKERQKELEANFGYLKDSFPKFYKELLKTFDTADIIERGKDRTAITNKEEENSIKLSDDLTLFFSNISKLNLEGISIDFDDIELKTINSVQYLVLGEFWLYGDGDLLLYDLATQNVFVYAHEYRPPQIIRVAKTIIELVENNFTKYLKERA